MDDPASLIVTRRVTVSRPTAGVPAVANPSSGQLPRVMV
jgi:hypothetical protein